MNDQELYQTARNIADYILSLKTKELWMQDWRKEAPNPFNSQTQQGLFLEMYYGLPNRLWTPWGEWNFGGSGSGYWEVTHPKILQRLGAVEYQPLRHTKSREHGPVYALHEFDGVSLPEPIERQRNQYLDYEVAKKAWEALSLS